MIRRELDDMMRLASAADVNVALEEFVDKVLTVVKTRNYLWKK